MSRIALALFVMLPLCASAQMAPEDMKSLAQEESAWRPGQPIPPRLLVFPSGNLPHPAECGIGAMLDSGAFVYQAIQSDALLAEILLEPRSNQNAIEQVALRIVNKNGLPALRRLLATRRADRSYLQTLRQALNVRIVHLSVASIDKDDMPIERARIALLKMQQQLKDGASWKAALAETQDDFPDGVRLANPDVGRTLVGFRFDGWISASGFNPGTLSFTDNIPQKYLPSIVTAGVGTGIIEGETGLYLYQVTEISDPVESE